MVLLDIFVETDLERGNEASHLRYGRSKYEHQKMHGVSNAFNVGD